MIALHVLVFGSGAILMALEILGSRIMAPYFGSSVYVWGSLISVFLTALSAGYYLGGRLADERPHRSSLTLLLTAAGALTAMIPLLADHVAEALVSWGPRMGALAAASAIFLPATLVLGMVSPLAIRLGVAEITHLGQASGRLYAVSTAGSVAGTLLTTFLLIPLTGTKFLVTGLVAALFILVAISFLTERKYGLMGAAATLAALLVMFGPSGTLVGHYEYVEGRGLLRTVYAVESAYHNIRVMDGDGVRYLRFDRSWQTAMTLSDPFESRLSYTDYFHLAVANNPNIRDVLVVGLGGGAAPKKFWKDYPQVSVDAVEQDPRVVDVARRFFALPEDERLKVHVEDGRKYLESTSKQYDLIILDAYYSDSIPFHLTTREFVRTVERRLKPGGMVAFNLIGALEGPESQFFRSMYRTVGELFPTRLPVAVRWREYPQANIRRNIILFASKDKVNVEAFKTAARTAAEKLEAP